MRKDKKTKILLAGTLRRRETRGVYIMNFKSYILCVRRVSASLREIFGVFLGGLKINK
jgi:hypothetical protein